VRAALLVKDQMSSGLFTLQQDCVHQARETVQLITKRTDATSQDPRSGHPSLMKPSHYRIWQLLQECVYREPICDVEKCKQRMVNTWADVK